MTNQQTKVFVEVRQKWCKKTGLCLRYDILLHDNNKLEWYLVPLVVFAPLLIMWELLTDTVSYNPTPEQ